ncbi:MAG: hypothetical protein A2782_04195 [Candidatus Blackburnbacteria bacterium RIFCSPHIGHO2_01_FULL_43_15b]|uniref:Addiction module toxin RelE n=1 Tax=Candidatus Blackburnbacteria bacterium RIFCSPHIGHO2_01_FULL_43_15b TaxID=1797513 RepID=A0A1G1V011_9BACT|nr:MAG: hypothetical protein A2782_04195 [Candidatus Blackburnbacteria bacterium RIFCSPHIGHO2_01_FULL_43_15b]
MQVILSKRAAKQYGRFSKTEQAKIKKKLVILETNPFAGKKLSGELAEDRSLRAWPYRIIYSINKVRQQVEVSSILHRQGAYK